MLSLNEVCEIALAVHSCAFFPACRVRVRLSVIFRLTPIGSGLAGEHSVGDGDASGRVLHPSST